MFVYVQDKDGKPLMPTQRLGMVRRWLKSGRTRIVQREPFTIPSAKGFKRGDRVQLTDGREGFVFGLRSSGYFDVRRLDGTVLHHSAGHKALRRVEGARTLRIERIAGSERSGASSTPPPTPPCTEG